VQLLQAEVAAGRTVVTVSHDEAVVHHLGGHRIALDAAPSGDGPALAAEGRTLIAAGRRGRRGRAR
jgi:hypothetical protein